MAEIVEVTARIPKDDKEATVRFAQPQSVEEAVEMFGADTVLNQAISNVKVMLQGVIRRLLDASKTQDEIAALLEGWKPGDTVEGFGKDPIARTMKVFDGLDAAGKKALLEELMKKSNEAGE